MAVISSTTIVTWALYFRDVALTVLSVVSLFLSILWVSVFLYGSFYFFYMPSQTYEIPLNFRFDPCDSNDVSIIGVKCSFLEAEVSFKSGNHQTAEFNLLPGQSYMVSLELVMPPTENNQKVGMFMSCLTLTDDNGADLHTKCLSAMMEFRSFLAQTMRTILTYPFKMFSAGREKSVVTIDFFDNYFDNVHRPSRGAKFVIQSRFIDIYESKLKVHAHFRGLRYLMYYYPVLSSFLGASLIGIVLSSVLAVTWKRFFEPTVIVKADTFSEKQERAKLALEKSPRQLRVVEKVRNMSRIEDDNQRQKIADELSCPDSNLPPSSCHDSTRLEDLIDDVSSGIEVTQGDASDAILRQRTLKR